MERKNSVKRHQRIMADRYWLANHFFAADSSVLAIWVVSCLSQVIGMEVGGESGGGCIYTERGEREKDAGEEEKITGR